MLLGFAAVGAIRLLGAKGSLAGALGAVAAFALLFGDGFVRNRARNLDIFPPSEINRQNRWKYLTLAAVLWIGVFANWWYVARLLPK